ncbi:uroporphyrinogen decarboxylase [Tieghemostelium lacteum]|uniref:Uroporphyrinogen decarboxylase n=1 Tax=Tieghemostelium lacteum TaxID=361077 RepID=A0A152AAB9_TIELA|nr:uroporphyrinogen decarboxylase [Tieghemostelium lacteum]|eukprot:KYR03166.1 uroporphyrinogen decarboxylase [Tieghemostelium lacteum]
MTEQFPVLKNDLFLRACNGEDVERVPVWIMRQAGRYLPEFKSVRADSDFFKVCQTPELACTVTIQPILRFPLDAAIIFSDILVIPQAMGLEVQMIPGKGPHFPDPIKTIDDLKRVQFPISVQEKLGYVFDAITLTRHKLEGKVPLIGFTGAPWTLFTYCIEGGGGTDLKESKLWLLQHPQESHKFLQKLTDVAVDYLCGQIKAGAQAAQVFDSWSGELSPQMFDEFCLPYLIQISRRVKEVYPNVPLICFPKGSNFALKKLAEQSSYNVLGVDWTISPEAAREMVGLKVTLQGNLDPITLYAGKDIIHKQVETMIKGFGTKRYIANLGHGMQPQMTPEMAEYFVSSVHQISEDLIKHQK